MTQPKPILGKLTRYPVALTQALRVIRVAQRLPEPDGPRHGDAGSGPGLNLLVFGDSAAAGVGVTRQQEALSGQLVSGLAPHFRVRWRLHAASGTTSGWGVRTLKSMPPARIDIAVLSLGLNDVKNGVPERVWAANVEAILDLLQSKHAARRIYWSALPPIERFPLLPDPLRSILGDRGKRFDAVLRGRLENRPEGRHLPLDLALDETHMATDGFHPGAGIYAEWAGRICTAILAEPLASGPPGDQATSDSAFFRSTDTS